MAEIGGAAGIFFVAGEIDIEPVRFETRAVRMDDQSVPRVRVRVQILLCAVHARIHGTGRRGIREKDFCEKRCRAAAGLRYFAQIFVCFGEVRGNAAGAHRDRDGDGPVSACGTRIRGDAGVPGGVGEAGRFEYFDHHEVESNCARHRCAEKDCGAFHAANQYYSDDAATEAGALAGAARSAAGRSTRGGEGVARGRIGCGGVGVAAVAGHNGWRGRTRSGGGGGERSGCAMVFLGSVVFDAIVGEAILAVCAGEVSAAGETVRPVVRAERLRAGRIPPCGQRAGGAVAKEAGICVTAVG